MATKKKTPRQVGKLFKITVLLTTDMDNDIDEYDVKYAACDGQQILDVQIVEKPINEF